MQGSIEVEFLDENGSLTLSVVSALDGQSISGSGKYILESNQSWALEGIISTPFEGYEKFKATLSLDDRDFETDYRFNVEKPLEMMSLLDVTLSTVNLPGPKLEMLFFGSTVDEPFGVNATFLQTEESYEAQLSTLAMAQSVNINGSFSFANESYAVAFDLETSFVEQLKFAQLNGKVVLDEGDFVSSFDLKVPFEMLKTVSAMCSFNETDFVIELETSRPELPYTSLSLHYGFSDESSSFESSATLITPMENWQNVSLVVNLPIYRPNSAPIENATNYSDYNYESFNNPSNFSSYSDYDGNETYEFNHEILLMLRLPGEEYSLKANLLLNSTKSELLGQIQLDLAGQKFGSSLQLNGNDIYQIRLDVETPFIGFEHCSCDIKGKINETQWDEEDLLLDSNRDSIAYEFETDVIYGKENLNFLANFQLDSEDDVVITFNLSTPFDTLKTGRTMISFNATDFVIELETSRAELPFTSLNLHYAYIKEFSRFETSFRLITPMKNWQDIGLVVHIPIESVNSDYDYESLNNPGNFSSYSDYDGNETYEFNHEILLLLRLPEKEYSLKAKLLLNSTNSELQGQIQLDLAGEKFGSSLLLNANELYQIRLDVETPIIGFEHCSCDIKGKFNQTQWGEEEGPLVTNSDHIALEFETDFTYGKENLNVMTHFRLNQEGDFVSTFNLSTPFDTLKTARTMILFNANDFVIELETSRPELPITSLSLHYGYSNESSSFESSASLITPLKNWENISLVVNLPIYRPTSSLMDNFTDYNYDYNIGDDEEIRYTTNSNFSDDKPWEFNHEILLTLMYPKKEYSLKANLLQNSTSGLHGQIQLDLAGKKYVSSVVLKEQIHDFVLNQEEPVGLERYFFVWTIDANVNYGKQNLDFSVNHRQNNMGDIHTIFNLSTTFDTLKTASTMISSNATDFVIELETSRPELPFTSLNLNYGFSNESSSFESSATLITPLKNWENISLVVNLPIYRPTSSPMDNSTDYDIYNNNFEDDENSYPTNSNYSDDNPYESNHEMLITLMYPKKQYSLKANLLQNGTNSRLQGQIQLDLEGKKIGSSLLLNGNDIYQMRLDIDTPMIGFEHYSFDIKGNVDSTLPAEVEILLHWNSDPIKFTSNIKAEPRVYNFECQLTTPFAGFERYGAHLRLEDTERKTFQAILEGPKMRAGADFDFNFNSTTDFIGKK